VLNNLSLAGVLLLMVPESACIPIPSEVTMMAAGFGVHQGAFGFPAAVAAGTAGNLIGSVIAYWAGRHGALRVAGSVITERCGRIFEFTETERSSSLASFSWRARLSPSPPVRPACLSAGSSR
jgi:membrane protein DedA with SNARE-associated domain